MRAERDSVVISTRSPMGVAVFFVTYMIIVMPGLFAVSFGSFPPMAGIWLAGGALLAAFIAGATTHLLSARPRFFAIDAGSQTLRHWAGGDAEAQSVALAQVNGFEASRDVRSIFPSAHHILARCTGSADHALSVLENVHLKPHDPKRAQLTLNTLLDLAKRG